MHDAGCAIEYERQGRQAVRYKVDPEDLCGREREQQAACVVAKVEREREQHAAGDDEYFRQVRREQKAQTLLDVLVNAATFFHCGHDRREVVIEEHQICDFAADVRAALPHRHANVRTFERRRVVHSVARHRHNLTLRLQRFDELQLLLRADSCEDIDVVQRGTVRSHQIVAGQYTRARDANFLSDGQCGCRVIAGHQSATLKDNRQLPENSPEAHELGDMIVAALERSPLFITAALPLRVFPPLFNRYEGGEAFGAHLDNSIRQIPGTPYRIRTDISATLFLSAPETYDGGELVISDVYGTHAVKLAAGDMVVYPASSLHHVNPVMRGVRLAAFFWVQSMVRDDGQRTLLFDLDMAINKVNQALPNHSAVVELTNCYHNLLRRFAEV